MNAEFSSKDGEGGGTSWLVFGSDKVTDNTQTQGNNWHRELLLYCWLLQGKGYPSSLNTQILTQYLE